MNALSFRMRLLAGAPLLLLAIDQAHATGHTAIDFTATDTGSPSAIGQFFYEPADPTIAGNCASGVGPASCVLHLTNTTLSNQTTGPINLGFNISFGGNTYSSLYINENGIVTFGNPIASGSAWVPEASLAGLQSLIGDPFIAASYADFDTAGSNATFFDISDSSVLYQRGQATLNESQTGTLLNTFSVDWVDSSLGGGTAAQLMIYSLDSSGDFAIRFRDGTPFSSNLNIGQLIGYSLDGASAGISAPLDEDTDYLYTFRGSTTSVPEPGTLALGIAGLLGAALTRYRRRAGS